MENQTLDPVNALLAEFATRINEVEEKQRLIRDRSLLIGENLVSTKEDMEKQETEIRNQINQINSEIKNLKQLVNRIINTLPNLARKSELEILEHQAKIFQPLQFARINDIKRIIEQELQNKPIKK